MTDEDRIYAVSGIPHPLFFCALRVLTYAVDLKLDEVLSPNENASERHRALFERFKEDVAEHRARMRLQAISEALMDSLELEGEERNALYCTLRSFESNFAQTREAAEEFERTAAVPIGGLFAPPDPGDVN